MIDDKSKQDSVIINSDEEARRLLYDSNSQLSLIALLLEKEIIIPQEELMGIRVTIRDATKKINSATGYLLK